MCVPGGPVLFQFFSERYERGSALVTTNLEFSRWTEVFQDVSLTAALLDRLTPHSHVFLFTRGSYRFSERAERGYPLAEGVSPFSSTKVGPFWIDKHTFSLLFLFSLFSFLFSLFSFLFSLFSFLFSLFSFSSCAFYLFFCKKPFLKVNPRAFLQGFWVFSEYPGQEERLLLRLTPEGSAGR